MVFADVSGVFSGMLTTPSIPYRFCVTPEVYVPFTLVMVIGENTFTKVSIAVEDRVIVGASRIFHLIKKSLSSSKLRVGIS